MQHIPAPSPGEGAAEADMVIRIKQRITGYSVVPPAGKAAAPDERELQPEPSMPASGPTAPGQAPIVQMHENLQRPEVLVGNTYKIKSPLVEHAMYVTINDIVLNAGTEHESRRPFEVFINSKNMDHFQWIVALTRIMSAVFRKGGDVTFLVEEMKAVFDPRGGYFKTGGVYMPSIVAEIGSVVEAHLKSIGMIAEPGLSAEQQALVAAKREQAGADGQGFPASATLCLKCNTRAVVLLDGCQTCLSCGFSKCG